MLEQYRGRHVSQVECILSRLEERGPCLTDNVWQNVPWAPTHFTSSCPSFETKQTFLISFVARFFATCLLGSFKKGTGKERSKETTHCIIIVTARVGRDGNLDRDDPIYRDANNGIPADPAVGGETLADKTSKSMAVQRAKEYSMASRKGTCTKTTTHVDMSLHPYAI